MITYIPSYIVAESLDGPYDARQPVCYLPLWEHVARRAIQLFPYDLECVNDDTSGTGFHDLQGFSTPGQLKKALVRIFACVGSRWRSGRFLAACGIKRWADLAKPIRLPGWPRVVPAFHGVRERRLKKPGPNASHPEAVFGQRSVIRFDTDRRWTFEILYGYSHSSSWRVSIRQELGESLYRFGQRIPAFVRSLFEERDFPEFRDRENRDYDSLSAAVDALFSDECNGRNGEFVRALLATREPGRVFSPRIVLTAERLAALRRWKTSGWKHGESDPDAEVTR